MTAKRFSAWLHRKLLAFYPAEFREEFGTQIEQDFHSEMARSRRWGMATLWRRTVADWLAAVPREQAEVTRRDLRICGRALARSPLFTLVVVLSLAVGLAATTVVFTIANALLIASPLDDPSGLVGVLRGDGAAEPSSWPDYIDYRDRNQSFAQLAAWNVTPVFLGRGDRSQSVMAETVSDNYFDLLRVRPFLGRLFISGGCRPSCAQEVILSHRFWRRVYGGDPGIVGRQVPLSGVPATIAGIAPEGFDGTLAPVMTDIWIHLENRRLTNPELFSDRRIRWLAIAGRLKDGVSGTHAIAELNGIDRQLQREHGGAGHEDRRLWAPAARGIAVPHIRKRVEMMVALLGAVAVLILLISCANVANMILTRATARRQETALRRALGASNSRLMRTALTESLLLAALGGIAGLLASIWITGLLPELQPPANDLYTYRIAIHLDWRVWVFTTAVSLISGILFGALPALEAARADCMQAIRNQDPAGRPRWLGRSSLASLQVALSLVLLVTAGLFYRSLASQEQIAPGLPAAHGLIVPLNLNLESYTGNEAKGRRFFETVKQRVSMLPGVRSASLASYLPLNATAPGIQVRSGPATPVRAGLNLIDPEYLATMEIRLVGGRNFSSHDRQGSERVALIDERLCRRLWPAAPGPLDAVGRTLHVGEERTPVRVVGIVGSQLRRSLTEQPRPALFLPVAQRYAPMLYLALRTALPEEALMDPIRRIVESVDDTVSVRRMRTMNQQVKDVLWPLRTGSRVIASGSLVAALLTVVGLYGVMAYTIARRQREMGIRMALGARPVDVLRLVTRQGLKVTLWGLLLGLPLAAAVNAALARVLYGVPRMDAPLAAGASAIWILIAVLASLPPAWRALRNAAAAIREPG